MAPVIQQPHYIQLDPRQLIEMYSPLPGEIEQCQQGRREECLPLWPLRKFLNDPWHRQQEDSDIAEPVINGQERQDGQSRNCKNIAASLPKSALSKAVQSSQLQDCKR